jgi:AraC-like DNA-binding protein
MDRIFRITRIGPEEAKKINSTPIEPHKHDYESLIIGSTGILEHFVDFKTTVVEAPLVSFIAKGKIHKVNTLLDNGKFDMWLLRFNSDFIAETVFQLYSAYHDRSNQILNRGECFDRLNSVCEIINNEMKCGSPDLSIVRHLLSALIIMIEAERGKMATKNNESINFIQNETFINFLKILEENFRRPLGVEFYAEKLFMSSRNLNLICQRIMNQSVSEIIETRKLTEAKNLLAGTNKSISEIGFELGFNEKSYFSNVFKKKSGQTPTEFREEMKAIIS